MKTIDTTKLWIVHPATEVSHPEICGPGGICMDVYDATTEQAQEIAEMLNASSLTNGAYMQGEALADFKAPYSVTMRQGDCEIVYSAPAADEVIWMVKQREQETPGDSDPTINVTINRVGGLDYAEVPLREGTNRIENPNFEICKRECAQEAGTLPERTVVDESVTYFGGRQAGKTNQIIYDLTRRIAALQQEVAHVTEVARERNDRLVVQAKEIEELESRCANMQVLTDNLTYERKAWENTAASYLGSMHWYQEQLDRCGVALGPDAYVSDDGSIQDTPLRAKIAEMVERLCKDSVGSIPRLNVHQLISGALYEFASKLTTRPGILTVGSACESAPMAEELAEFCSLHGLTGSPDVEGWSQKIARVEQNEADTRGPCAKQTVTATIITPDGRHFTGTNDCLRAQVSCPRDAAGMKTGEGYHLCRDVCQQTGHAEINALRAAGDAAKGARMVITGHTYACKPCIDACVKAGIVSIEFGAIPTPYQPADPSIEDIRQAAYKEGFQKAEELLGEELKSLRAKTQCALGVGDGSGRLLVYGDHDSIKAAQRRVLSPYIPDVPAMRQAFITYESGQGNYSMVFKFKSLPQMHQAGREWSELEWALKHRSEQK